MKLSSPPTSLLSSGTDAVPLVVTTAHDLRSQGYEFFHHNLRTINRM